MVGHARCRARDLQDVEVGCGQEPATVKWQARRDSNPQSGDPKSPALPAMLRASGIIAPLVIL